MTIAPKILPGHVNQRLNRVSRLLFHWRASDFSLTPVTGETPTFVRATGGGLVLDSRGYLRNVAQAQPRWDMSGYDAASGLWLTPVLLLEGQRINLCLYSETLNDASWTKGGAGSVVVTDGAFRLGTLTLSRLVNPAANNSLYRSVTLAGGTEAFSVHVRGDGTAAAYEIVLQDSGATNRFVGAVAISAAGIVTATPSAGTVLAIQLLGQGVYRVLCQAPTCAAGAGAIMAFSSAAAQSFYTGGVQVEDAPFPSSYIPTPAGGTVTRNADLPSYPFLAPPQAMTAYIKLVAVATTGKVLMISSVGNDSPYFLLQAPGVYYLEHHNGAGAVAVAAAAPPAYGDIVEVRCVLQANGAVRIGQSLNGAAEVVSAASAANALAANWSAQVLHVNSLGNGADPGFCGLRAIKFAAAVQTMDYLRSAF